MNLYYNLPLTLGIACVDLGGGCVIKTLAWGEATVKYHPGDFWCLTWTPHRGWGQWLVGSLTGAVASQKVTEAR